VGRVRVAAGHRLPTIVEAAVLAKSSLYREDWPAAISPDLLNLIGAVKALF